MNQQQLIQLAKAGNKKALVDLLKSIEKPIYKTAFYFMGNEHDAKDVAQEALIKVYTKLNTFQDKSQFNTWVQRIVTNICMDKFRKNKNFVSIEGSEMVLASKLNIEQEIENKVMMEELITQIMLLPEKIKAVMILRYLHDFSYQEIAQILDLPINTVKSYLFRGRDKLQSEYSKGGLRDD
ncbi:RNA polymerase subunit sigma [Vulcanibacillus modesticaldus]|uniref:RNA polymerase subunit sigma n=1 Tax=Vulcanibacillus modesticaldus TaxID=337097 RepID=A0A1D2YS78_9BACI|nr:sigma-70 family RNA polymerase sigma factor [Vulcanibacillus modesticaldus]OEF96906.1 RNA polymerase subunit sigma [Vulcanibacillus modesticaldus]